MSPYSIYTIFSIPPDNPNALWVFEKTGQTQIFHYPEVDLSALPIYSMPPRDGEYFKVTIPFLYLSELYYPDEENLDEYIIPTVILKRDETIDPYYANQKIINVSSPDDGEPGKCDITQSPSVCICRENQTISVYWKAENTNNPVENTDNPVENTDNPVKEIVFSWGAAPDNSPWKRESGAELIACTLTWDTNGIPTVTCTDPDEQTTPTP